MKLLSPRNLAAAVAVLLSSVLPATADDSFSGTWKITDARTLGGKAYTGTVRIAKIGAVYELRWNTTAGKYLGLGLADGNKLCTGWGGKNFGVVLYKINGDGSLTGAGLFPARTKPKARKKRMAGRLTS